MRSGAQSTPDSLRPRPPVRADRSIADFQRQVPIRTYEAMWEAYFRDAYPIFDDLTWPGRIPFLALTSGTTQGATKYIPVTAEMVASNRKAAQTMLAFHLRARPDSRLFGGRMFFLGGATALEQPAPGVRQGDLSGIAAVALSPALNALHVSAGRACPRFRLGSKARETRRAELARTDHAGRRSAELAAACCSSASWKKPARIRWPRSGRASRS